MASAEEVKLDRAIDMLKILVYYTRDEINIHPDTVRPGVQPLYLKEVVNNVSVPITGQIEFFNRDGFRWMRLFLRDVTGVPVVSKEWQCVYRDPYNGTIINRPAS